MPVIESVVFDKDHFFYYAIMETFAVSLRLSKPALKEFWVKTILNVKKNIPPMITESFFTFADFSSKKKTKKARRKGLFLNQRSKNVIAFNQKFLSLSKILKSRLQKKSHLILNHKYNILGCCFAMNSLKQEGYYFFFLFFFLEQNQKLSVHA